MVRCEHFSFGASVSPRIHRHSLLTCAFSFRMSSTDIPLAGMSRVESRGWHVTSRKSLIPRTSASSAVCPLELKCSPTGKPGAFLLMLQRCSPKRSLRGQANFNMLPPSQLMLMALTTPPLQLMTSLFLMIFSMSQVKEKYSQPS